MSDNPRPLQLEWLPGRYAVCRLHCGATLPGWIGSRLTVETPGVFSVTRTDQEVSIVIEQSLVPSTLDFNDNVQRDFLAVRVVGSLDFALVGVLSRLTSALAAAGVSVFVLSTYQTDIILTRAAQASAAFEALRSLCDIPAPPPDGAGWGTAREPRPPVSGD
jgi:hypothetical protein